MSRTGLDDHGGIPAETPVDVLDSGPGIARRRAADASPARGRVLVAALGVLVLAVVGTVWYRERAAEQEVAQRVALTTSLGVSSSSTTPPGGEVGYFVVVRNDGPRPVEVTAVEGATDRLRLTMRYDHQPRLDPGTVNAIALSVRLSCRPGSSPAELPVEIQVRRQDGGTTSRRVDLQPSALVGDVATTLCAVRPGLRDHVLSGSVLRHG